MKPVNRDMERTLIQPERMSLPDRLWLEAGRAREFMDEDMQHGDVLRHASTVLARNLRERHFVGMVPNPVIPPRVHFNHPLSEMGSEPLEPVPPAEEQALPVPSATDSQAAPDTQVDVQSLPVAENTTAVALCFGTDS